MQYKFGVGAVMNELCCARWISNLHWLTAGLSLINVREHILQLARRQTTP